MEFRFNWFSIVFWSVLVACVSPFVLLPIFLPETAKADELAPLFEDKEKPANKPAEKPVAKDTNKQQRPFSGPRAYVFQGNDSASQITPPDERSPLRVNPEAPPSFIGIVEGLVNDDRVTAKMYAHQFVRYLSDLTFTVKDITALIGEALVDQKKIEEDDLVGVGQYLDYELAGARAEEGSPFKATHEEALDRIKPDPQGDIEVYYFFTLNSSHSRKMAPDVERLWRYSKSDPKIKMVALTLGPTEKNWVKSFRDFTGLTAPIFNGEDMAKLFKVAFVPAVVVVTVNSPAVYLKTGEQSFQRMYEFVRKAQGKDLILTADAEKLMKTTIGKALVTKDSPNGKQVITVENKVNRKNEKAL